MTEVRIWIEFKPNIILKDSQKASIGDILKITGEHSEELYKCSPSMKIIPGSMITAVDAVAMVREFKHDADIVFLGQGRALVGKNVNDQKGALIKLIPILIILFFGMAMSVMYFHADVDMPKTQSRLYSFFTGEEGNTLWVSLPYSLGLGVGVSLYFGIFSKKKKSKKPNPIELQLYKHENDVYNYIKNEEEKEQD